MSTIGQVVQTFQQAVFRTMQDHNSRMISRMTTQRLSGGGPSSLRRQGGRLAGSLRGEVIGNNTPLVVARTSIGGSGVLSAGVHETGATLTPKSAKNLAIPLGAARHPSGTPKVSGPRAWPKPLQVITTKGGKKLLIETRTKTIESSGFNFMGTKGRQRVRVRDRKTFTVILPGGRRVKGARNEIVKAVFALRPSVTVPPRLGFFETFRQEAQTTVSRLIALAKFP